VRSPVELPLDAEHSISVSVRAGALPVSTCAPVGGLLVRPRSPWGQRPAITAQAKRSIHTASADPRDDYPCVQESALTRCSG